MSTNQRERECLSEVSPYWNPQLNGKVESSHRSDQEEFYQLLDYKDDVDLHKKLEAWEHFVNSEGESRRQANLIRIRRQGEIHQKTTSRWARNLHTLQLLTWSGREDLNLRPLAPRASALPYCATPRPGIFANCAHANYDSLAPIS